MPTRMWRAYSGYLSRESDRASPTKALHLPQLRSELVGNLVTTPPNHPDGTVHKTKAEAEATELVEY